MVCFIDCLDYRVGGGETELKNYLKEYLLFNYLKLYFIDFSEWVNLLLW